MLTDCNTISMTQQMACTGEPRLREPRNMLTLDIYGVCCEYASCCGVRVLFLYWHGVEKALFYI